MSESLLKAMDRVLKDIGELARDGAFTDGDHHKQYALYEICKVLGVEEGIEEKGIPS